MTEPVQPYTLTKLPVSENLENVLETLAQYKKKINNSNTLLDNDPSSVTQLKKRLLHDSRILKQFVNNHKRTNYKQPIAISKELEKCLEQLDTLIQPSQKENILSAISFMFEQYPFTPNIEHTLRQIYTEEDIDTNDGDPYDEEDNEEW